MPDVLLVNPRRRRRKAKAKSTHRRRRAAAPKRRRRSYARAVAHNPRRRRRTHRAHARRRSVRRRRRNPSLRGMTGSPIMRGVALALGIKGTKILASKLAAFIPASWGLDPNVARIGSEAVVAIGVPMLAKKLRVIPANIANAIALGGTALVVLDIIDTYLAPHIPLLNDYDDNMPIGAYREGELSAYREGSLSGMGESAYGDGAYS